MVVLTEVSLLSAEKVVRVLRIFYFIAEEFSYSKDIVVVLTEFSLLSAEKVVRGQRIFYFIAGEFSCTKRNRGCVYRIFVDTSRKKLFVFGESSISSQKNFNVQREIVIVYTEFSLIPAEKTLFVFGESSIASQKNFIVQREIVVVSTEFSLLPTEKKFCSCSENLSFHRRRILLYKKKRGCIYRICVLTAEKKNFILAFDISDSPQRNFAYIQGNLSCTC